MLTLMMIHHMIRKPDGGTHTDTYAHIKLVQYHMSRKTADVNESSAWVGNLMIKNQIAPSLSPTRGLWLLPRGEGPHAHHVTAAHASVKIVADVSNFPPPRVGGSIWSLSLIEWCWIAIQIATEEI